MSSKPFISHIYAAAAANEKFREVIYTGEKSQLVIMSIPPKGEIGEETHDHVEQTLFFLSGQGKAVIEGEEHEIGTGMAVIIPPGTRHNFINTGDEDLKIYTVYAPANHIDGRVHLTKEEADADVEDEQFGHGQS